jgi:hypothetical protein
MRIQPLLASCPWDQRLPLAFCLLLTGLTWARAEAPNPQPSSLLLAETTSGKLDPAPYWVSEKLDGMRALWDGRQLRFRSGNRVPAPAWFTAAHPPQALDGELWIARKRFEQVSGIVRTNPPNDAGKTFRIGAGLSDALRRNPPPIGSLIIYRYQTLTQDGVPRFARYLRVREEF